MNIGTVVEGPSDRVALEAILNHLCPGEHRYFPLQPTETFGETGTGWKGVRRWCREIRQRAGSTLEKILSGETGPPLDLLIIQVDADIVTKTDLQEGSPHPITEIQQPCPPIQATVDKLEQMIRQVWLEQEELPINVILAIPAQDMENWSFAALFPEDKLCLQEDYECIKAGAKWREHVGYCLTLAKYGKRLQRKDGTIKKPVRQYEKLAPALVNNWVIVCQICTQAKRFDQVVERFVYYQNLPD